MKLFLDNRTRKIIWATRVLVVILVLGNVWALMSMVKAEKEHDLAVMKSETKLRTLKDEKKELVTMLKTAEQMVAQANADAKAAVPEYNNEERRYLAMTDDEQKVASLSASLFRVPEWGIDLFVSNPKKADELQPFSLGVGRSTTVTVGCGGGMEVYRTTGIKLLETRQITKQYEDYAARLEVNGKEVWLYRGNLLGFSPKDEQPTIPGLKLDADGVITPVVKTGAGQMLNVFLFNVTKDKVFLIAERNAC